MAEALTTEAEFDLIELERKCRLVEGQITDVT
jgi:hypothetical protein